MPRANRYHLPGYVWHITQRCHRKQFLLRFVRDRRTWVSWVFEARRRYGLCVLNYTVTSNHIHLLVRDRGGGEIAPSMQLIAGRTAQAYNARKRHHGAFWEDRYHATAVDTGEHLARCLVYIDLNMVRAGVVGHPEEWESSGYHEIQQAPARRRIVDREELSAGLGLDSPSQLAAAHQEWIANALGAPAKRRERHWSESLAVGRRSFVEQVHAELGQRARYRFVQQSNRFDHVLHEAEAAYGRHLDGEIGRPSPGMG